MPSEDLRAVFSAVETISETLDDIGQSISSLQREFSMLDGSMSSNTAVSASHEKQLEQVGSTIDDVEKELEQAVNAYASLSGVQSANVSTSAAQTAAMEQAGRAIDDAGDEALSAAAQMGVLDTVMKELSLSGSALSVNIGAFNVSLRNLAPIIPIAASMGTLVTVIGGFITAIGAASVALAGFTAGGAIAFLDEMERKFEGITNRAEALEAVMGGVRDLFVEAIEPLQTNADMGFFVNLVEGAADLTNRLAQAIDQMRGSFMPLFSGIADIINDEFDNIANAIETMMETMNPVLLSFFEWFMVKLPDALLFMARVTRDLAGPFGNLGNSVLDLLTSIIDTAVAVFQGLAPAFSTALDTATALIDTFNVLGNGLLQTTVFMGALTFAAFKFASIADTIANIGITAANRWVQFGKGASSALSGGMGALDSFTKKTFEHLRALGMVITGQMDLADAAGQTDKEMQDAAEQVEELEQKLEALRSEYQRLVLTVEGGGVGNEIGDEMDKAGRAMTDGGEDIAQASDEISESVSAGAGARVFAPGKDIHGERVESPDMPELPSGEDTGSKSQLAGLFGAGAAAEVGEETGEEVAEESVEGFTGVASKKTKAAGGRIQKSTKLMASKASGAMLPVVATVGELATATSSASGTLATLSTAVTGAGSAIVGALSAVPPILLAIAALSGLVVGVLGNMDDISSAASGAFSTLKDVMSSLGSSMMKMAVPAWNLMVDLLETILAPLFGVFDGLKSIAIQFGLISGEGDSLSGILDILLTAFDELMKLTGGLFKHLSDGFSLVADFIHTGFITPLQIVGGILKFLHQVSTSIFNLLVSRIPMLSQFLSFMGDQFQALKSFIAELPALFVTFSEGVKKIIDEVVDGINAALQPAVDFINKLIRQANKVPEVDIDTVDFDGIGGGPSASDSFTGAKTTAEEVRENVRSDEEEPQDDVATEPDVNLSLEDSVENNVDVQADPEEKAQLSRITKDALEEANSFARRQQGGQ